MSSAIKSTVPRSTDALSTVQLSTDALSTVQLSTDALSTVQLSSDALSTVPRATIVLTSDESSTSDTPGLITAMKSSEADEWRKEIDSEYKTLLEEKT